jgi:hypothetical protein
MVSGGGANVEKTPGVFRLAVLGASVTMGAGVSDEEVYTSQLQKLLDEKMPARFEVLNFAVGGHHALQIEQHFWKHVERFKPDLVILKFDVERAHNIFQVRHLREIRERNLELRYHLVDFFSLQTIRIWARDELQALRRLGWYGHSAHWREPGKRAVGEQRLSEGRIYSRFAGELAEKNYMVALLRLPDIRLVENRTAQQLAKKRWPMWKDRITHDMVINTNKDLAGRVSLDDRIYPGELHPNARVHKAYGESIFKQLWPKLEELAEADH